MRGSYEFRAVHACPHQANYQLQSRMQSAQMPADLALSLALRSKVGELDCCFLNRLGDWRLEVD